MKSSLRLETTGAAVPCTQTPSLQIPLRHCELSEQRPPFGTSVGVAVGVEVTVRVAVLVAVAVAVGVAVGVRVRQEHGSVPVASQTSPGGHVVGSHEGPLPPQVGPHEQPEPLSVHVSPGMHAPPQVGAVPLSQRVWQVHGLVPVAVQT
jgi:hypothetical protein